MKIDYHKILKMNLINVLKDVLKNIEKNGLQEGHHLYITIDTNNKKILIPKWLKEKHPDEITIVIQYEYWNFHVKGNFFSIGLSFNDTKADLEIPYDSIISFADPFANFGLRLKNKEQITEKKIKLKSKKEKHNLKANVIDFKKYKKN
ncbi:ClpXP protease specificity-enhancing factor SspB [Alphaproteobacteria bacterium]|nr:ClpXP protease specificity-enhancing factor SspB [Alphaproteobacteria bacterium]